MTPVADQGDVRRIAVRVSREMEKRMLLAAVDVEELDALITDAWRCQAHRRLG
jgi:hypothetical protein